MKIYDRIAKCRLCGSGKLKAAVKFKPQFVATTLVKTNENNPSARLKAPLTLMLCGKCGLAQLQETMKPDLLYRTYFYRSSVGETMRRDLRTVVDDVLSRVDAKPGDRVLDIGCNDGLMLAMFPPNLKRVGIDPAQNIDRSHHDKSITFIKDYFPSEQLAGQKFKVITSTAMFYDLNDPNKAVKDIKKLLDKDGVVCLQVSSLCAMIKDLNFYDICHEHLEYYSLKTLCELLRRNGMTVFDASTNEVNGGSLRVMVAHKEAKRPISENLKYLLLTEEIFHLEDEGTYKTFTKLVEHSTRQVRRYIDDALKEKKKVIALGASTKGNVMLQLCGIDKKIIPYISERNTAKVGLRTAGTDIELISEDSARAMMPYCMFVIPWNFKAEIVAREKDYLDRGGRLLFIMPRPYVIDKDGEKRL
jgi:SAM-dependent methyltransferase